MVRRAAAESQIFSARLREVRAATGKSLKDLEKLTATSDSSLSRYLSGATCPPWSVVELLCGAAGRDPATLREAWEQAQRQRSADRIAAARAPDAGGGATAGPAWRRRRARWRMLVASGVLVVAITGGLFYAHPWANASTHRTCPWQYIVTDGDPAPVLIFDQPGAGRRRIGEYPPSQIFYAPEPPQVQDRRMRTQDGWINQGDWIRRYPGPCRG